jgi:uncharacterized protein (TIGR02231 family)
VIVYPDRAAVTRRVIVACKDRASAEFAHLPPAADATSFRAQARGGTVEGVRASESTRTSAFSPRVAALDQRLRRLDEQLADAEAHLTRIEAGGENSEAFRSITEERVTRELAAARPDVTAWKAALATVLETGLAAARSRTPVDARLRALHRERDALAAERTALTAAAERKEHRVEVEVACPEAGEVAVALSYTVGGAFWSPAYEARADEQAATVELATFATVRQATGEDWRGARLVLSTAQPRRSATPPQITPLAVFAEKRDDPGKQLVTRTEAVHHAEAADPRAAAGATTGTGLRAKAQGTSVQMTLPAPADVPGDGAPVRLLVARNRLKAELHLRTTPRLAPCVFRVADAFNGAPFALLPGAVDVFRGGSFVARHPLPETPPGGRLTVSLGVDERVRASRLILEESRKSVGLLGRTRQLRYRYRFEIESHLGRPEEVELGDQIPVSELDDVAVVMDGGTSAGYSLDRRDGLVRWRWRLAPGERRILDLAFHVDVPSRYE